MFISNFVTALTLCIRETPQQILLQTVKTHMKCSIMLKIKKCPYLNALGCKFDLDVK